MDSVMNIARELGQSIAKSEEFTKLAASEKLLMGDKVSMALLKDYDEEKAKMASYQNFGLPVPPDKLKKVEDLRDSIQNNNLIRDLLEAQKQYEGLLKKVNDEINKAIEQEGKGPVIV
jgi:cell fate (sporulation/competence/biofilm development) regulator YlbF (YheA/YmcA/DUF963 family)